MLKYLAMALIGFCCGCASTVAVSERCAGGTDVVYPATRYDAFFWACCCLPGSGHAPCGVTDYSEPLVWVVIPVATVCCVVDLVPSLLTDTVLLPVDIAQR